eukprot:gnl/TRDRNA2_/TRDRNA2_132381_c0_seq2.p1 gnl/TRDRNA2_/TRDRNA2_132381_c0~~gnl/TRDRNA2_/TRDRNA2_132381_c0_seq2.p1  ORF type:complete len:1029 (-),score=250.90 gnl/TRDRNA2_/TRDRNA2_132381_c0_seq2:47-2956(-)
MTKIEDALRQERTAFVHNARSQLSQLQTSLEQHLADGLDALRAEVAGSEERSARRLVHERDERQAAIAQIRRDLDGRMVASSEDLRAALVSIQSALSAQQAQSQQQALDARTALAGLETQRSQQQLQAAAMEAAHADIRGFLSQQTELQEQHSMAVRDLRRDLQELTTRVDLLNKNAKQEEELPSARVTSKLEALMAVHSTIEEHAQRLNASDAKVAMQATNFREDNERLEIEVSALSARMDVFSRELQAASEGIDAERNDRLGAFRELGRQSELLEIEFKAIVDAREAQRDTYIASLDCLRNRMDDMEEDLKEKHGVHSGFEKRMESFESELKASADVREAQNGQHAGSVDSLHKRMEGMENDVKELVNKDSQLSQQLTANKAVTLLEEKTEELRRTIEDLSVEVKARLDAQRTSTQARLDAGLDGKVDKDVITALAEDVAVLRSSMEGAGLTASAEAMLKERIEVMSVEIRSAITAEIEASSTLISSMLGARIESSIVDLRAEFASQRSEENTASLPASTDKEDLSQLICEERSARQAAETYLEIWLKRVDHQVQALTEVSASGSSGCLAQRSEVHDEKGDEGESNEQCVATYAAPSSSVTAESGPEAFESQAQAGESALEEKAVDTAAVATGESTAEGTGVAMTASNDDVSDALLCNELKRSLETLVAKVNQTFQPKEPQPAAAALALSSTSPKQTQLSTNTDHLEADEPPVPSEKGEIGSDSGAPPKAVRFARMASEHVIPANEPESPDSSRGAISATVDQDSPSGSELPAHLSSMSLADAVRELREENLTLRQTIVGIVEGMHDDKGKVVGPSGAAGGKMAAHPKGVALSGTSVQPQSQLKAPPPAGKGAGAAAHASMQKLALSQAHGGTPTASNVSLPGRRSDDIAQLGSIAGGKPPPSRTDSFASSVGQASVHSGGGSHTDAPAPGSAAAPVPYNMSPQASAFAPRRYAPVPQARGFPQVYR